MGGRKKYIYRLAAGHLIWTETPRQDLCILLPNPLPLQKGNMGLGNRDAVTDAAELPRLHNSSLSARNVMTMKRKQKCFNKAYVLRPFEMRQLECIL